MFLLGISTFIANNTTNSAVISSRELSHQVVTTQDILIVGALMAFIFIGLPLGMGLVSILRRKFGDF